MARCSPRPPNGSRLTSRQALRSASEARSGLSNRLVACSNLDGDVDDVPENGELNSSLVSDEPAIDLAGMDTDPDANGRIKSAL
jgi:hypothetical protein